jgi:hypothetical protein
MSFNKIQKKRIAQLKRFIAIVTQKLETLPEDIKKWHDKASEHEAGTEAYNKVIELSIEPREQYLDVCRNMDSALKKIQKAVILKTSSDDVVKADITMPIETLIQQYCNMTRLKGSTGTDIREYVNTVLQNLDTIEQVLNQKELSGKDIRISIKDAVTLIESLQEGVTARVGLKAELHTRRVSECEALILQKVAIDVESRQAVRDRTVIYASLQTYMSNLEANTLFHELPPNLKYKVRQVMARPIDSILKQQAQESDLATKELQSFLAPIQGETKIQVPNSAKSVHQLIQQAVGQQEALVELKVNVMDAFKNLVKQMESLFEYQPFTPVQASSVLGAAWMQSPLTDPDSIQEFKYQLESIQKTESYQALATYFDKRTLDASFKYVDKRITDVSNQLDIQEKVSAEGYANQGVVDAEPDDTDAFLGLFHMEDVCMQRVMLDPVTIRRIIIGRMGYMTSVRDYICQMTQSLQAHVLLAYYEHSLNPESFNLNQKLKALLLQVPKEFYERKRSDKNIDQAVFYTVVQQVFDTLSDTELAKNQSIVNQRHLVRSLIHKIGRTNSAARSELRKKVIKERNRLKKMMISVNMPRVRQFVDTLSKPEFQGVHDVSDKIVDLKHQLGVMVQHQIVLSPH